VVAGEAATKLLLDLATTAHAPSPLESTRVGTGPAVDCEDGPRLGDGSRGAVLEALLAVRARMPNRAEPNAGTQGAALDEKLQAALIRRSTTDPA
jgi:hypothetical protein